jgi:hypothetical protein
MWDDACVLTNRVTASALQPGTPVTGKHEAQEGTSTNCKKASKVQAWTAGSVVVDDVNRRIATDGLTAGVETHLANGKALAGLAVGTSRSRDRLNATDQVRTSTGSVSLYVAARPQPGIQLTAAVGRTDVEADTDRELGSTGRMASMHRDGHVWYGLMGAAADLPIGTAIVSPYVRGVMTLTHLGEAGESSADPLDVNLASVSERQMDALFGATFRRPIRLGDAVLTPYGRLEYRWHHDGSFNQQLSYADQDIFDSSVGGASRDQSSWVAAGGVRYLTGPFSAGIEVSTRGQNSKSAPSTVRANVGLSF